MNRCAVTVGLATSWCLLLSLDGLGQPAVALPSPAPAAAATACQLPLAAHTRPGLPARAAALLMSGQQGGAVTFSVLAVPLETRAGTITLAYLVDIDGTSLFGDQPGTAATVEVAVYAMTAGGGVSASSSLVVWADPNLCPTALSPAGLRVAGTLELPEGEHALRVLVRNAVTGDFGVGELPRALAATAEGGALLAAPMALEPAVWATAVEDGAAEALRPVLTPAWAEPGRALSTRPLMAVGTTVGLMLPARGVPAGTRSATTRVLDQTGKEIAHGELATGDRQAQVLGGLDLWKAAWKVPDLPEELYFLEVTMPGALPGSKVVGTLPFLPRTSAQSPTPFVWAALDGVAVPEEPSQRAAYLASRGRKDEASPKVKAGYRAALMQAVSGDFEATATAVSDLERSVLVSGSPRELEGVLWAEMQVAKDLAGDRPESPLALVLLHRKLYDRYSRTRAFIPQAHERRLVEALIDLWVDRSKAPDTRVRAAELLANLAATVQDAGLDASAARLFKRSTEMDKGCAAGLIGMAAGLERSGAYRQAVRFLEQLVEAHPKHAEGNLRLAVNQLRVGSSARAKTLLRACLAADSPKWVRTVAYQELARLEIANGDLDAARSLLGQAGQQGLDDGQIRVLEVDVLDRQGRMREAYDAALRATAAQPGPDEVSARLRYSRWPSDDQDAIRTRLETATPAAWETLREAVRAARWEAGT